MHYFDLTEDVEVTRRVSALARNSARAFVPQCGLAPGFISIAGGELIRHFDSLRSVRLRVGALPQHPHNVLKYSLTWSTEGLINEYGNPCEAIVDGRLVEIRPLEGLEEIEIDGTLYEAFNTSGGLGSLAQTCGEHCESMDYKTIRYPGHCAQMRLLMNDLKLNHDRATLKRILENAVPQTLQDVVIVYAAVTGMQQRRAARGELRQQDLSADDRRPAVVRDPGQHRLGAVRGAGPGAQRARASTAAWSRRNRSACRTSSPTASAGISPPAAARISPGDVVLSGAPGRQRALHA